MKPNSNTITNLPLTIFTHPRNEPMPEPSSKSTSNTEPQFAIPLQEILPDNVHTNSQSIPHKKPIKRSSKMVRIPCLNPQDRLSFLNSVRKVRITFDSLRLLFSHEKEAHDQRAASLMNTHGLWLNRDKRIIGSIPGVNVGDIFFYRTELLIIGLHGQNIGGVDYISAASTECGEPIATSIVVLTRDEDDYDKADEFIYTSPPKRSQRANKHCAGKKIEEDILALKRSMTYEVEVRVIRDILCDCSPTKKVYVYDGVYKIVQWCKEEAAKSGFYVHKFKLLRIKGQEETGSSKFTRATNLKVNPRSVRPNGYLSLDMSKGKERFPVPLFNDIDELDDPLLFQYANQPLFSKHTYEKVFKKTRHGCKCVASCGADCYCVTLNEGKLPYDEDGILKRGKPVIYECGQWCRCPLDCGNRVSQGGIKKNFEVYRDLTTEWSVRSLDFIRAGSFLFEMNGLVLPKKEVKMNTVECERSLAYPNEFPSRWREWGDTSDVIPDSKPCDLPSLPELEFVIDVSTRRSVSSYLSHSGVSPNVFVQYVLYNHHDHAYPHLMVFASENIPPLRELSFDYGR